MQALQLRPRLDADLLDQRVARVAVGLERVRLAAAAVERQHPLGVQALAQRVVGQQRLDLGDDLLVAAGGQVGVDRELRGGQAQLLDPADLRERERLVGDVGQRLAAEQRERLPRRCPVRGRARASATSRSSRRTSTSSRSICSSYARPRVTIAAPPSAPSALRNRQT